MTKFEFDKKMLRLQQGDENAFEEIYIETHRALFSYILSICRNYHTAEDVLQTTYIRLRTTVSLYKAGANAYAWLYTIAKNITLNEIARQKHEMATDIDQNVADFGTYTMDEDSVGEESPATKVMNKVLNDEERQVVSLRLSGFKHREIAEMMEKPLGTIMWEYNNALAKMKRELQKEGRYET